MAHSLISNSKFDIESAIRAVETGYPGVQPVLAELVEWLQDCNWPVAQVLSPFLAGIGLPLVPCIDHVFLTNDETWKYWMIVCLISQNDDLFNYYKPRLIEYATNSSENDRHYELVEISRETLSEHGYFDD